MPPASLALLPLLVGLGMLVAGGAGQPGHDVLAGLRTPTIIVTISSPSDGAVISDGNLVLIEGTVSSDAGPVDAVEISVNDQQDWIRVEPGAARGTWRHVWQDPPAGLYRIYARVGLGHATTTTRLPVTVQVRDIWRSPFTIMNPYRGSGSYTKGQLHVHSTNSFDGWTSLPPAQLAQEYRKRGYGFVAITDHEVVSLAREVEDAGFITIPAFESTSDSGHVTGLYVEQPVRPEWAARERIAEIAQRGGMSILNHPGWQIGWKDTDIKALSGYFAIEVYNGLTSTDVRAQRNLKLWHEALNNKGWPNPPWAVAVDDAHAVSQIDRGWVMVKSPTLTAAHLRTALERGAFYASNGPSFATLGILNGAIVASSPEAQSIRFIDQDARVLREDPPNGGAQYRPTGQERWIRVEAVQEDGRTAWSQPFWVFPNAPTARATARGVAGETLPGAMVHVSGGGTYLGNVVADERGHYDFTPALLAKDSHDLLITATARLPDRFESAGTRLRFSRVPGAPSL